MTAALLSHLVVSHRRGDRGEQRLRVHGFSEVRHRSCFHRPFARIVRIVAGDDDDRNPDSGSCHPRLDAKAVDVGHLEIQHDAVRLLLGNRLDEFISARKRFRVEPGRTEQPREGATDRFLVVDDRDQGWIVGHSSDVTSLRRQGEDWTFV